MDGDNKIVTNSLIGGMLKYQEKAENVIVRILNEKLQGCGLEYDKVHVMTNENGGPLYCDEYI
jgi:hypothetical protein